MWTGKRILCVASIAVLFGGVDAALAKPKVRIDPAAITTASGEPQPEVYTAAWLTFAAAKLAALDTLLEKRKGYVPNDDYAVELQARTALADYWRDAQQHGARADAYLDKLVEIAAAGFMEEYVLETFSQAGWTVSTADLAAVDFDAFHVWGSLHLVDFESETLSGIEPDSERISDEPPGYWLPDAEQFMPSQVPCATSMATLREAAARWQAEARELEGAAVAAKDRRELITLLVKLRDQEPYRSRGITFVESRVGDDIFFAGYCSVDLQDFDAAKPLLEESIGLIPLATAPRLELAQVFIAQRKLDAADAVVDDVLQMTTDRCDLGRGWRKRGYIRFEQGRLEEARSAYKLSLEYDPLSKIAPSELELLETEIANHGGKPEPYQAPPTLPQTATACAPTAWL